MRVRDVRMTDLDLGKHEPEDRERLDLVVEREPAESEFR